MVCRIQMVSNGSVNARLDNVWFRKKYVESKYSEKNTHISTNVKALHVSERARARRIMNIIPKKPKRNTDKHNLNAIFEKDREKKSSIGLHWVATYVRIYICPFIITYTGRTEWIYETDTERLLSSTHPHFILARSLLFCDFCLPC